MVGPNSHVCVCSGVLILGSIHMYMWRRLGRRCFPGVTAALSCITDEGVVPTQTKHTIELNETWPSRIIFMKINKKNVLFKKN